MAKRPRHLTCKVTFSVHGTRGEDHLYTAIGRGRTHNAAVAVAKSRAMSEARADMTPRGAQVFDMVCSDRPERSFRRKRGLSGDSGSIRWFSKKYGLTAEQARKFIANPNRARIERSLESWRERNGFPAPNSPLVRGKLIEDAGLKGRRR